MDVHRECHCRGQGGQSQPSLCATPVHRGYRGGQERRLWGLRGRPGGAFAGAATPDWPRRPLSRIRLASVRNALLACMWLGCGSPGSLEADGFPTEHRAPITVECGQQPRAAVEGAGWSCIEQSTSAIRYNHTATLLPSGKVLVVGGGANATAGTLSSAELYDLNLGKWETIEKVMSTPRYRHTATLLPSGKVLVTGGMDSQGSTLKSVEVYDPKNKSWESKTPMSLARSQHTATLLPSGRVLITGGAAEQGVINRHSEVYDPLEDTCISGGSHEPSPLRSHGNALAHRQRPGRRGLQSVGSRGIQRELVDASRSDEDQPLGHTATPLLRARCWSPGAPRTASTRTARNRYDPSTRAWSLAGSMAEARLEHTATLLHSGKVLVVGGHVGVPSGLSSAEEYDPGTDTWSPSAILNSGRFWAHGDALAHRRRAGRRRIWECSAQHRGAVRSGARRLEG